MNAKFCHKVRLPNVSHTCLIGFKSGDMQAMVKPQFHELRDLLHCARSSPYFVLVSGTNPNQDSSVNRIGVQSRLIKFECSCILWSRWPRVPLDNTGNLTGLRECNSTLFSLFLMVWPLTNTCWLVLLDSPIWSLVLDFLQLAASQRHPTAFRDLNDDFPELKVVLLNKHS